MLSEKGNRFLFMLGMCILLLSFGSPLSAQAFPEPELIPVRSGSCDDCKWGYCDRNKQLVIPYQFDYAGRFRKGYAKVRNNGKSWFINPKGEMITRKTYDDLSRFREIRIAGNEAGKKGLLDSTGREVLPLIYDRVHWVGVRDDKGRYSLSDSFVTVEVNDEWGLYTSSGREIIPPIFGWWPNIDNNLIINRKWKGDRLYGIYDLEGNLLLPHVFDNLEHQHWVGDGDLFIASNRQYKKGLINLKGDTLTPFDYRYFSSFKDGMALVYNGRFGFVNESGKLVIPTRFLHASNFRDGRAVAKAEDSTYYLIDKQGNLLRDLGREFVWMGMPVDNRIPGKLSDSLLVFVDTVGNKVFDHVFDGIGHQYEGGYAIVFRNHPSGEIHPWGGRLKTVLLIDREGNEILSTAEYSAHQSTLREYRKAMIEGRCYSIKKPGNTDLRPDEVDSIYQEELQEFNGKKIFPEVEKGQIALARLRFGDKMGMVDQKGNWFAEPIYDHVARPWYSSEQNPWEPLILVKKGEKYGFLSKNGKVAIPIKYDKANKFEYGLAYVRLNGRGFYIDRYGTEYLVPK